MTDQPKSMLDEAVELLHKNKGQWRQTARDTGLDYNWLAKLSQGAINDPGVRKIETLVHYLSERQEQDKPAA